MTDPTAGTTPEMRIRDDTSEVVVASFRTMRLWLGILGIVLPFVFVIGGLIAEACLRTSISAYYHADEPILHGAFVGILCAMGFFLIAYTGYPKVGDEKISDNTISWIAGTGALGVAVLPTLHRLFEAPPDGSSLQCVATDCTENCVGGDLSVMYSVLHFSSALVFFGAVAVMCFVFFTRTRPIFELRGDGVERFTGRERVRLGSRKWRENMFYRLCGTVIVACILLIGIEAFFVDGKPPQAWWPFYWLPSPVFWFEAVAVWALAFAWLVKGEWLSRRTN